MGLEHMIHIHGHTSRLYSNKYVLIINVWGFVNSIKMILLF